MPRPTLIRAPPVDPSKSPLENSLELTTLSDVGPDVFTNTHEIWHPPNARGVFGGAVIAHCLIAAQKTIPPPSPANGNASFLIHSMHCYFVLAGDSTVPILYHVERVREGKSFMTRTVQARQKGKSIFTTTCSFMREGSEGEKVLEHEWPMPEGPVEVLEEMLKKDEARPGEDAARMAEKRFGVINSSSPNPHTRKTRQWIRASGNISPSGGQDSHLGALAYMSDSYFVGTIPLVHLVPRSSRPSDNLSQILQSSRKPPFSRLAVAETGENPPPKSSAPGSTPDEPTIGMLVSLDHSIYFHRPREVIADDWLLAENESPWSGEGRGLVIQKIWNRGGRLLATCVQEGLVRLIQDPSAAAPKPVAKKSKL